MKAFEIDEILNKDGRLILRDYPFGLVYIIEDDDGFEYKLNVKQFRKFKESCNNKDESQNKGLRGETTEWYYWRDK